MSGPYHPLPASMTITIIQYADAGNSEREKWLNASRVRSHAAKVSHAKRVRPTGRCQKACVSLSRADDWYFGGMAFTLSELDGREVDLLQSCIRHTPEAIMDGHIVRSPAAASAVRQMTFPVLKDLFQRSISHEGLFVSTLPTAAMLVVQNPQHRLPLRDMMDSSRSRAVQCVRQDLGAVDGAISIYTKLAVMNLCIPALVAGDINATDIHLQGLLALRPALNLSDPLNSLIWYVARTIAVCHAIQISQSPLYPLDDIPTNDQWAIGYGHLPVALATTHCSQHAQSNNMSTGRRRQQQQRKGASVEIHDTEPDSSPYSSTTQRPNSKADSIKDKIPVWKAAQLVSDVADAGVWLYRSAICSYPQLACSNHDVAKNLNLMYNQRLAALHQLCTVYYSTSRSGGDPPSAGVFDASVMVALQIHLVLDLGGLLSTAVSTLCHRLYANLRLTLSEKRPHVDSSKYGLRVERQHCEVWLLLTGFMATTSLADLHQWFREETLSRMRALRAWTEPDVWSLCDPFGLGPDLLSPVFLGCAMNLAEACHWVPDEITPDAEASYEQSDPCMVRDSLA